MEPARQKRSKRKLTPESEEESADIITKNYCYTNINVVKCNFTWTIKNFSFWCGKKGEQLKSSQFSADDNDAIKWYLAIYPKGTLDKNDLPIYLHLASFNGKEVKAKVKLSLINVDERASIVRQFEYTYENRNNGRGYEKMLTLDLLMNKEFGWLPEDKLTIFCELFCHSGSECNNVNWKNSNIHKSQFIKDIGSIFKDTQHSDVTFFVGDRQFNAHKVILAARSPVFAAMFTHKMKENDENHVHIVDIDNEIFEEMLRFMYSDKVPNLQKNAKKLLAIANKYVMKDLKAMCDEELCSNFTIETAADLLIFADLHDAYQLKRNIKQFICSHLKDVIKTLGWRNMISSHSFLVAEIVELQAGALQAEQVI